MFEKLSSYILSFSLSNLSSLQLFQLLRYAAFVFIGIGFAKLHLPLSEIGQFETLLLISGMLSFFWVSGTINSMLTVFPKKNQHDQQELLFNTFLSLVLFSLATAGILFTFSSNLLSFYEKDQNNGIIYLTILYILFSCPSFIVEYVLFLHHRKKEILYSATFFSFLTVAAVLVPVLLHANLKYSIFGLVGVAALKFLFTLFVLSKFSRFVFNPQLQIAQLKLSLPVMLSFFVSGSAEYIDGIIVKSKFDNVSFAVFRYGAKELPILLIMANTLSAAMIPSIANHLHDGLSELKRKSTQLMHVFFPITMALMLISPYLYKYAFSDSFIYSALIFNIYLLLIIPRVVFPQTIVTGLGQTKFLLLSSIIEISINVSVSLWLASKIGLPGIALGSLIAYSADKIFLVSVNYFVNNIRPNQYLKSSTFCIYSVACCCTFIATYILLQKI